VATHAYRRNLQLDTTVSIYPRPMTNPTDRNATEIRAAFTNLVVQSLPLPDKFDEFERLRGEATRCAASAFTAEATAGYLALLVEMDNWYKKQRKQPSD
jgi:hypothetical protein